MVTRIPPNGDMLHAPPKNFGAIKNAHNIRLSTNNNDHTPWDSCFESDFDFADSNLNEILDWLSNLERSPKKNTLSRCDRFYPMAVTDEYLQIGIRILRNCETCGIETQ